MDNCMLCPGGTRCKGVVLHGQVLKLYDAMEAGQASDDIARAIGFGNMAILTDCCQQARKNCWSKGFVLILASKLVDLTRQEMDDAALRVAIERMVLRVDRLFAKLPNGISVESSDLALEVYNQACEALTAVGVGFLPANILGQAYSQLQQDKAAALAR